MMVALAFIVALTLVGVSMSDIAILQQRMATNYVNTVGDQMTQNVVLRNSIGQIRQVFQYDAGYDDECQVMWDREISKNTVTVNANSNNKVANTSYTYTDIYVDNPCILTGIDADHKYTAAFENLTESNAYASYSDGVDIGQFWVDEDATDSTQVIRFGDHDLDGNVEMYTDKSGYTSWNSPVHLVSSTYTDRDNTQLVVARYPGPPIFASIYTEDEIYVTSSIAVSQVKDSGTSSCGYVFGAHTPSTATGQTFTDGIDFGLFMVAKKNISADNASRLASLTEDDWGNNASGGTQRGHYLNIDQSTTPSNDLTTFGLPDFSVSTVFNKLKASAPYTTLSTSDLTSTTQNSLLARRNYYKGTGTPADTITIGYPATRLNGLFLIDANNQPVRIVFASDNALEGLWIIINASAIEMRGSIDGALLTDSRINITSTYQKEYKLNPCRILQALQSESLYVLQTHIK